MSITVSLVEDDADTRTCMAQLLAKEKEFFCVSQHPNGEDAIRKLPEIKPRVVLMDLNLPGVSGVVTVRALKELCPETQFIMLTVNEDLDVIFSALKAGATGYLLKRTPASQVLAAIREVCDGGSPMTSQIARKVIQSFQEDKIPVGGTEELSPREMEVLELLAQGYLYKEISDRLQISFRTVSTHIEHIYGKLHVHSRTQAVAKHLQQSKSRRTT